MNIQRPLSLGNPTDSSGRRVSMERWTVFLWMSMFLLLGNALFAQSLTGDLFRNPLKSSASPSVDAAASVAADDIESSSTEALQKRYVEARIRYLQDLQSLQDQELQLLTRQVQPSDTAAPETKPESDSQYSPGEEEPHVPFWQRLRRAGNVFLTIWNLKLVTLGSEPVTIGKIVLGIVALVVGLLFARHLTVFVRRRAISRLRINENAAMALEKVFFYFVAILVVLFSLQLVNIPLSIFAFLGGAIALALGFGAQNILNNFISGWILMIERPIKIGDMIEVEGQYGSVESIGARCTRIRMFNGIHILVPNSDLLEKNVVNWTLSDDRVRVFVSVGVAYGSPTRKVETLIRQAVDEHEKILKEPAPIVVFEDFGDNALLFEVHFWVTVKRLMDGRRIKSDIRFRIDDLLREANITIAFPQRDIHIDSLKPIEVRVLSDEEGRKRLHDDEQAVEKVEADEALRRERDPKTGGAPKG